MLKKQEREGYHTAPFAVMGPKQYGYLRRELNVPHKIISLADELLTEGVESTTPLSREDLEGLAEIFNVKDSDLKEADEVRIKMLQIIPKEPPFDVSIQEYYNL